MMGQAEIFFSDEFEMEFRPDFGESEQGEAGLVRIEVRGEDEEGGPATVVGFFTPQHARDAAAALTRIADLADKPLEVRRSER